MSILIKTENDGSDLNTWALIEIQGDLESRTSSNLESQFIGDLYFKNQEGNNVPVLIIGHHILYGKIQDLDKPLAVMEPCQNVSESPSNAKGYIIKAIVTRKVAFKIRPKPIIAN